MGVREEVLFWFWCLKGKQNYIIVIMIEFYELGSK